MFEAYLVSYPILPIFATEQGHLMAKTPLFCEIVNIGSPPIEIVLFPTDGLAKWEG